MRRTHRLPLFLFSLAAAALACGGTKPNAEAPPTGLLGAAGAEAEPEEQEPPLTAADPELDEPSTGLEEEEEEEDEGKPSSRGAAIQRVVKDRRQKVRDCYLAGLEQDPSLRGDLVIHFKVDAEGRIAEARLVEDRSEILAPKVVECAIAALKAMEFPPHPEGMETEVNYPFRFNP